MLWSMSTPTKWTILPSQAVFQRKLVSGSKAVSIKTISLAVYEAVASLEAAEAGALTYTDTTTKIYFTEKSPKSTLHKSQDQGVLTAPAVSVGRDYDVVSSARSKIVGAMTGTQTETLTPEAILNSQFNPSIFLVCSSE